MTEIDRPAAFQEAFAHLRENDRGDYCPFLDRAAERSPGV
jgi:hypothetical protein